MAEDFNNVYEHLVIKNAIKEHTVLDLDKIIEPGCKVKLFGCNIVFTGKIDEAIGSKLIYGTYVIEYKTYPTHFNFTYPNSDASTTISFEEINKLKKEDVLKLFETRVNKMINDLLFPDDN